VFVHPKVLADLEFDRILEEIASRARTRPARETIRALRPASSYEEVEEALHETDEYLKALLSGNRFPEDEFTPMGEELQKLRVENYFLDAEALLEVARMLDLVRAWHRHLQTFGPEYPVINRRFASLTPLPALVREIRGKILPGPEIKDNASPELARIREQIREVRRERDTLFARMRKHYEQKGYLDEIGESFIDDRPVLAVKLPYAKHLDGDYAGTSRTGNIVFMEPAETVPLTRRLRRLHAEEEAEIIRILKRLSDEVRANLDEVLRQEAFLIHMDAVRAKALFARDTDSSLPAPDREGELVLKEAYHPLLLLENRKRGLPVIPQDIRLTPRRRILVISGPNAGGKSITLKTVGLLQLMFQSGLLIPVHPDTRLRFFEKILTDIGDHQSIENQLSTYSYRLKNMKLFLRLADKDTLFLIDEFGSGSDPDLGGALAEVFLELFNRRGAYGVITTHYNNLKLLAEKLDGTVNAHMAFDLRRLAPLYKLRIGEPGSSYTFEVARKIGIPEHLIGKARKKVDRKKVEFDRTLAHMQEKMRQLEKEIDRWKTKRQELEKQIAEYREKEIGLLKKLNAFRELYEQDRQVWENGRKMKEWLENFRRHGDRRKMWRDFIKWAEKTHLKQVESSSPPSPRRLEKARKEVREVIRREDVRRKLEEALIEHSDYKPAVGDRVVLAGSTSEGVITGIKGTVATVNYGKFTAEVPLSDLRPAKNSSAQ